MTPTSGGDTKIAGTGLIASLVGIRGVFSAVVVAVHLSPFALALTPGAAPVWTYVWHHGYWVLDLFFVLSGFVITSGYRSTFARWPGRDAYGRFLWARLSRFYPLHLAVLAALVVAVLAGPLVGVGIPHGGDLGSDLTRHVLLTQGWGGATSLSWNGPTWSLSSEWFCYLLVPLLIPLVLRFRTPTAVVLGYLAAMAVPLAAYGVLGYDDAHITYIAPLWRTAGEFVAGGLLCQLLHVRSRLPALAGRLTGVLAAASLVLVGVLSVAGASLLFAIPLAALVILGLAQERGRLNALLSGPRALRSGEFSVALFLTHVPFLLATARLVTPERFPGAWGWLGVALLIAGALGVAVLSYLVVEVPAQRRMRRMVRRPAAGAGAPGVR